MMPAKVRLCLSAVTVLVVCSSVPRVARADSADRSGRAHDGVYDRFDGDLDLGLALGAEFGSVGQAAPALRATAHYFSIAGVYVSGRVKAGEQSAPSLLGVGIDLRPLFVPRWAKGFETGPGFFDLTLDSLSLSLGAFWSERASRAPESSTGFDAQIGFGLPLFASAGGPWLETRGVLRYADAAAREEAIIVALAWHGFATTPFSEAHE